MNLRKPWHRRFFVLAFAIVGWTPGETVADDGPLDDPQRPWIEPTVELIAIKTLAAKQTSSNRSSSAEQQKSETNQSEIWWDRDGEPLASMPDIQAAVSMKQAYPQPKPHQAARAILIRATLDSRDMIELKMPKQGMVVRLPQRVDGQPWKEIQRRSKAAGERWQPMTAKQIVYGVAASTVTPANAATFDFEAQVASGPWEEIGVQPPPPAGQFTVQPTSFRPLSGRAMSAVEWERTLQRLSDTGKLSVAMRDQDGQMHEPSMSTVIQAEGELPQFGIKFKLAAKKQKEWVLRWRKQYRFLFDNVANYPRSIDPSHQVRIAGALAEFDLLQPAFEARSHSPKSLDWIDVRGGQLSLLGELPDLQRLYLASDRLDDAFPNQLAAMERLRFLRIESSAITPAVLASLRSKTLETLEVCLNDPNSPDPQTLRTLHRSMPTLRVLRLWDTEFSDESFAAMMACRQFEEIVGRGDRLTESALVELQDNPLRVLVLKNMTLTPAIGEQLAQLPNLERLELCDANIQSDALAKLASSRSLRWLDLEGSKATTKQFLQLNDSPSLKVIRLMRTPADRSVYEALKRTDENRVLTIAGGPASFPEKVRVNVRDDVGGPIGDATVMVTTADARRYATRTEWTGDLDSKPVTSGRTDDQGTVMIELPVGSIRDSLAFWVVSPEGGVVTKQFYKNGFRSSEIDLTFSSDTSVVKIVDPYGAPVQNAAVTPMAVRSDMASSIPIPALLLSQLTRRTLADGEVTFATKDFSRLKFWRVEAEAFGIQTTRELHTIRDGQRRLTLQLWPAKRYAVQSDQPGRAERLVVPDLLVEKYAKPKDESVDAIMHYGVAKLTPNLNGGFDPITLAEGSLRFAFPSGTLPEDRACDVDAVEVEVGVLDDAAEAVIRMRTFATKPASSWVRLADTWRSVRNHPIGLKAEIERTDFQLSSRSTDFAGRVRGHVLPGELRLENRRFVQGRDVPESTTDLYSATLSHEHRGGHQLGWEFVRQDDSTYRQPITMRSLVIRKGVVLRGDEPIESGTTVEFSTAEDGLPFEHGLVESRRTSAKGKLDVWEYTDIPYRRFRIEDGPRLQLVSRDPLKLVVIAKDEPSKIDDAADPLDNSKDQ